MDHATFHQSKKNKYLIKQAGCKILISPSYSSDLNLIEVFWANFKQLVRLSLNKLSSLAKDQVLQKPLIILFVKYAHKCTIKFN